MTTMNTHRSVPFLVQRIGIIAALSLSIIVASATPAAACASPAFFEVIAADLADFDDPDGSLATRYDGWLIDESSPEFAVPPVIEAIHKFEIVEVVPGNEELTAGGVEALTAVWGALPDDPELAMFTVEPQFRSTTYDAGEECGQAPIVDSELGQTRYRVVTDQRTHWLTSVPESIAADLDRQLGESTTITPGPAEVQNRVDLVAAEVAVESDVELGVEFEDEREFEDNSEEGEGSGLPIAIVVVAFAAAAVAVWAVRKTAKRTSN